MGMFTWLKRLLGGSPAASNRPAPALEKAVAKPASEAPTVIAGNEKPFFQEADNGKILVIDDSPTVIAVFRKILQPAGYNMIYAESAETGIRVARMEKPDLIFLDIVLPGMNGFAALRTMRKDPLTRAIPIVMISGNEQATEQFYADKIGADDFIKKPFKPSDVLARLEALVPHHRRPETPQPQAAAAR